MVTNSIFARNFFLRESLILVNQIRLSDNHLNGTDRCEMPCHNVGPDHRSHQNLLILGIY